MSKMIEIKPNEDDFDREVSNSIIKSLTQSEMPVSEAVSKNIVYCSPDTKLHEAAEIMARSKCSSILIRDGKKYIGIWTEYDSLKMDFSNTEIYDKAITEVMSSPIMTISNKLTMREVAVQMRLNKVRHFLVIDEKKEPYAIVTQTDIVLTPAVERYLKMQRVSNVLYHSPVIVGGDTLLSDASERMRRVKADAIIAITELGYGIITERDLTRFIANKTEDKPIVHLATIPLVTAPEETNLYEARRLLEQNKIRHLGIVNNKNKLLGIIGFADILSSMEFVYIQELSKVLRERNKALSYAEQQIHLFERVIETTNDGVCFIDTNGFILAINPAFTQVTGYHKEDIIEKKITNFNISNQGPGIERKSIKKILKKGRWSGEISFFTKAGKEIPARMMVNEVTDKAGKRIYFIAMISDLTHIKEREEKVRQLSHFNPLTNLPNREYLETKLKNFVEKNKRGGSFSVMLIDLNRFRRIVELMGKTASDYLLKIIAGRLHDSLRADDLLGHIGPDEFILILNNTCDLEKIQHLVERILVEVERPIHYNDEPMIITARVGIAIFPHDGDNAQDLIGNVYAAAMKAKEAGNNMYQFYSHQMNVELQKHVKLENDLRHALTEKNFVFYYQPIVDAKSREIIAFEALIRWKKGKEIISPGRFLTVAEEIGLIRDIGFCAFENLEQDYQVLKGAASSSPKIALNLSVRQFQDTEYMNKLMKSVIKYSIEPSAIIIELTESVFLHAGAENISKLEELRKMGFLVVLDDFGTGYSSLSYLRKLPADYVKLDKSFISELETDPESINFVEAIIHLAHTVHLPVVAEGVESQEVADKLEEAGCDMMQGYYFSRPAPVGQFNTKVSTNG